MIILNSETTFSKEALYNERVKLFDDAINHKESNRIPVIFMAETFVIGYAGKKIWDIQGDSKEELACFEKAWKDIYMDGAFASFLAREVRMYEPLGAKPYFYSNDGETIQSREFAFMKAEDYPELIKDASKYFRGKNLHAKYPNLQLPYPQNLEALKKSFGYYLNTIEKVPASITHAKEEFGIPVITGMPYVNAFDTLMDFFRGLPPIFADLRRRPQDVVDACDALVSFLLDNLFNGQETMSSFPYILMPVHAPTYLTRKQFIKFFWPSFKKALLEIHKRGGKVFMAMEGNWDHMIDCLLELPKDFIFAQLENTDIFKAKDIVGSNIALAGGIPMSMLKYMTKQQCIDHAKKVIDYCAPGGGYAFSMDKVALSQNDINIENLIAVNEFVHNYK